MRQRHTVELAARENPPGAYASSNSRGNSDLIAAATWAPRKLWPTGKYVSAAGNDVADGLSESRSLNAFSLSWSGCLPPERGHAGRKTHPAQCLRSALVVCGRPLLGQHRLAAV